MFSLTIPTLNQEFLQLMRIIKKLDFYKKQGYDPALPDHPAFFGIFIDHDDHEINDFQLQELFTQEIYDSNYFTQGKLHCEQQLTHIDSILDQTQSLLPHDFKLFSNYEIRLSAYGPGASYFEQGETALILMHTTRNGMFRQNAPDTIYQESPDPTATIVRGIIFLGVDHLVQHYHLTHNEKKALIDSLFTQIFVPRIQQYDPHFVHHNRQYSDPELLQQLETKQYTSLEELIKQYLLPKRKSEVEAYDILEECKFTHKEAKVYYHSLQLGFAPASRIAKHCGEKRLTVYNILQDLCKQGFAQEITRNNTKQYAVMSIKKLIEYKEFESKTITKKLESLLPSLAPTVHTHIQPLHIFYGVHQCVTTIQKLLKTPHIHVFGLRTQVTFDTETKNILQNIFQTPGYPANQWTIGCPSDEYSTLESFWNTKAYPHRVIQSIENIPLHTITLRYAPNIIVTFDGKQTTIIQNTAQFQFWQALLVKLT